MTFYGDANTSKNLKWRFEGRSFTLFVPQDKKFLTEGRSQFEFWRPLSTETSSISQNEDLPVSSEESPPPPVSPLPMHMACVLPSGLKEPTVLK